MHTFCYHDGYILSDSVNWDSFNSYNEFYTQQIDRLTFHISGTRITKFAESPECDTDMQRGQMILPTMTRWLFPFGYETEQLYDTLVPDSDNKILIVAWLSLFNMSTEHMDKVFGEFKGHVIVDDSFESHPFRTLVYKEWLESLGYDLSNVSFWSNGPNKDNKLDYSNKVFLYNWLHLCEYGWYLDPNKSNRIRKLGDVEKAKQFDNKKYQALYLNGHSTAQRELLLGHFVEADYLDNFLYSFRDPVDSYKKHFESATSKNRDLYIPKIIDDDTEISRSFVDRFKQDRWWEDAFYNVNVETNCHWIDYDIRMITEKWMKAVLYYTPSFMLGDYPGYEEYQTTLGFNNYSDYMDKSYDSIEDWSERTKAFAKCVQNTGKPSQTQWAEMMKIAENNHSHLHNDYIPKTLQLFDSIIQEITG